MTTSAPPPPRSRRWASLAMAVLALGTTGVLLGSHGVTGAGVAGAGVGLAGNPAVVQATTGAAPAAEIARPVRSKRPAREVSATQPVRVVGGAGPTRAQLRTVAAGLVDVDTVLDGGRARGAGTGIVLTADGAVLTNNHVVAGASSIVVTDLGNGRRYRGVVVGRDRSNDVAVLRAVGATGLAVAPLSNGSGLHVGSAVAGIGNAGGIGVPSVSPGVVTGLNRRITAQDEGSDAGETLTGMIATTAGLRPGDSGGALIDGTGGVVGLDTAAASDASSGFAIPIGRALAVARQIA